MGRFIGKSALITGAASGIGRASALAFAAEGARVAAYDLSGEGAEGTARAIRDAGGEAIALAGDAADSSAVRAAVEQTVEIFEVIDILFNNAGVAARERVTEQDEAGWDEVLRVNLRGVYICSKYALPHMKRPGGVVINTASVVGLVGVRNRAAYATSKGAIVTLTKNMALDYASDGIRVNAVCPGFVETGLTKALFADPVRGAAIKAMHPLGGFATADDISRAVLFLASDDARMITGQALAVDGGFTIGRPEDV